MQMGANLKEQKDTQPNWVAREMAGSCLSCTRIWQMRCAQGTAWVCRWCGHSIQVRDRLTQQIYIFWERCVHRLRAWDAYQPRRRGMLLQPKQIQNWVIMPRPVYGFMFTLLRWLLSARLKSFRCFEPYSFPGEQMSHLFRHTKQSVKVSLSYWALKFYLDKWLADLFGASGPSFVCLRCGVQREIQHWCQCA